MKLWIARDKDGTLILSNRQPYLPNKCYDFFYFDDDASIYYLDRNIFPEVTFDSSPQEVEIKLVNDMGSFAEDLHTKCKPLEGEFSKFVDDNFNELI